MDMTPTSNFITTLQQTPPLASQLSNDISQLKQVNDQLIQYLSYPQKVADDLTTLNDALTTANELLSVVVVIPEVGEAAAPLKDAIMVMLEEVTPAKNAAVNLANEVKPLLNILQQLDSVLADGISAAQNVVSTSTTFLNNFTSVAGCINSLPDGQPKETAQNYLNQFSQQAQPPTAALNTGMSDVNSAINTVYGEISNIANQLSPLAAIDDAINQVLNVLNPVIGVMSDLKNALMTIEIMIPLPYPHMVSLYDIFNTLGDFINLAMAPIQDLVNQLLSALNITLPSIPGLSDLLNINFNIPGIPDFSSLIQNFVNFFNQLAADIQLFKLNCPPAEDQTDFLTQLKG